MRGSSSRLAIVAMVVLGLGVLALAGRLFPTTPSARPSAATGRITVIPLAPESTTLTTQGTLVPYVVGRPLGEARTAMRLVGLSGVAVEQDPQAADAVVVSQEPPAGVWVPPKSPVGFRTRTDVWPNGTPRRLRLGSGPTTAQYRVVVGDPFYDPLTVAIIMPIRVELRVWLETGPGRRVPVLGGGSASSGCRPVNRQSRCLVRLDALTAEEPGVWTVGLAKLSIQPASVRITVRFTRR